MGGAREAMERFEDAAKAAANATAENAEQMRQSAEAARIDALFRLENARAIRAQTAALAEQRAREAKVSGDPQRIAQAERILWIEERINQLLAQRPGLSREDARSQAETESAELQAAGVSGAIRDDLVGGIRDGLRALAEGDLGGVFDGLADRFTSRILDSLANDLADMVIGAFEGDGSSGGLLSSIGSLFGKRATGGPVMAGQPYIVGERRPEVFVPNVNGTVIPSVNAAVNTVQGRGTSPAAQPITFDLRGAVMTADLLDQMNQIGLAAAVGAVQQGRTERAQAARIAPYRRG